MTPAAPQHPLKGVKNPPIFKLLVGVRPPLGGRARVSVTGGLAFQGAGPLQRDGGSKSYRQIVLLSTYFLS